MSDCVICGEPSEEEFTVSIPIARGDGAFLPSDAHFQADGRLEGPAHQQCYSGLYEALYGVPFE
jgi:hypothetical protein